MIYNSKRPLEHNEYIKFKIPSVVDAYEYKYDHIIEERSYDIEAEILSEGYTIHRDELVQVSTNVYNYIVIVSKN